MAAARLESWWRDSWTMLESAEDVDVLIADISHLLKYGGPTNERRESLNRVVAHLHAMK
jgi:hypothetical protein